MTDWLVIVSALAAGLGLGWALVAYLAACGARAELVAERLPPAAAQRQSAGLAAGWVLPGAWLAAQDGGLDGPGA